MVVGRIYTNVVHLCQLPPHRFAARPRAKEKTLRENTQIKQDKNSKNARPYVRKKGGSANEKRRNKIKKEGLEGHSVVTVRLRNAEFLEFTEQVEAAGLTNNRAFRIAARRISGFLEIDEDTQSTLRNIARQISGIASNINQLAKIANTTNSVDHSAFLEERKKLGLELAQLSDIQQQLLNVGRRRQDGVRRLEKAMSDVE